MGVANGSWAVLECNVEAFPESLCYWERFDGRSIETQHRASLRDYGKYEFKYRPPDGVVELRVVGHRQTGGYRFTDDPYGSWMRDASPRTGVDTDKY